MTGIEKPRVLVEFPYARAGRMRLVSLDDPNAFDGRGLALEYLSSDSMGAPSWQNAADSFQRWQVAEILAAVLGEIATVLGEGEGS